MSADWLSQLAPDHAPPPASWWPPAPGWWVLAALIVLLLVFTVRWLRSRARSMRRSALEELRLIRKSDADGPAVARAIENLLRRYAIAVFGSARVAKLSGESWLKFVAAEGGAALAGAAGSSLLVAAFGNHPADDREQWFAAAESFIKRAAAHRHKAAHPHQVRTAR
jgi:hypothetical protein